MQVCRVVRVRVTGSASRRRCRACRLAIRTGTQTKNRRALEAACPCCCAECVPDCCCDVVRNCRGNCRNSCRACDSALHLASVSRRHRSHRQQRQRRQAQLDDLRHENSPPPATSRHQPVRNGVPAIRRRRASHAAVMNPHLRRTNGSSCQEVNPYGSPPGQLGDRTVPWAVWPGLAQYPPSCR